MKLEINNIVLVNDGIVLVNRRGVFVSRNGMEVVDSTVSVEGKMEMRIFIHRPGYIVVNRERFMGIG